MCVGRGTAGTRDPLYYPGHGPSASGPFTTALSFGGCIPGLHSSVSTGSFTENPYGNSCAYATGTGSVDGHGFTFVMVGRVLVLSGDVVGVSHWSELEMNESCFTGADRFYVSDAVLLVSG